MLSLVVHSINVVYPTRMYRYVPVQLWHLVLHHPRKKINILLLPISFTNVLTSSFSSLVTRRSSRWYRDVVKLYGSWTVTIVAKKHSYLDCQSKMIDLFGFVWRSRRGSSGRGNLATRCDRTFSNSNATFLNEINNHLRSMNVIKWWTNRWRIWRFRSFSFCIISVWSLSIACWPRSTAWPSFTNVFCSHSFS